MQERDGLCWQRGGLLDLEGMLFVDVVVSELLENIKLRGFRVMDR